MMENSTPEENVASVPLFISGMPRSGTKLLRDVLNNHSCISIPRSETHFIPLFVREFGLQYSFNETGKLEEVLEAFYKTKFFLAQEKPRITIKAFQNLNKKIDWAVLLETILRYYGVKSEACPVFGDKTPGYVLHLPLLRSIWPNIRMVHIIRDPRDYAASVKKAWGMSLTRAAYRWSCTMKQASKYQQDFPENYLEVRYEDLLSDSDKLIATICEFIGCKFEPELSELKCATENLGAAKGHIGLVRTNKNLYLDNLSKREIQIVEGICCESGKILGYFGGDTFEPIRLSKAQLKVLRLYDGGQAVSFHIREKGLINGIRYFARLHKDGAFKGQIS